MRTLADTRNLEVIMTDEPQVCVLPNLAAMKIRDFLDDRKIEYRCVGQEKFEDGWPGGCVYRGKTYIRFVQAVITCVDKDCLLKIAEELFHVSTTS